ncbi:MAG: hypothetical protein AAGD01_12370 [Acidobacteriota bacterium]
MDLALLILSALLPVALLLAAGRALLPWLGPPPQGPGAGLAAVPLGLLLFWLGALGLTTFGLPWNAWTLLGPPLLLALAGLLLRRNIPTKAPEQAAVSSSLTGTSNRSGAPVPLGLLDVLSLLALGLHALASVKLWATNPDFVYHWGIKARHGLRVGELDLTYLGAGAFAPPHGDYPPLLPALFTAVGSLHGLLGGDPLDPRPWLLLSPLCLALVVLALRASTTVAGSSPFVVRGGTAAAALLLAGFATRHRLAGGPDLLLAAALSLGVLGLLRRQRGFSTGPGVPPLTLLTAALAAMTKTEGIAVALVLALLSAAYLHRSPSAPAEGSTPRSGTAKQLGAAAWRGLAVLGAALLTLLPWLLLARHHELFDPTLNAGGPPRLDHLPELLPAAGRALLHPHWHGAAVLLLLAALGALAIPKARLPALAALGHVALLLGAYLTARYEVELWVASSFPRLLVQAIPTAALAAALALDHWLASSPKAPSPERSRLGEAEAQS